ncbi:sentrin-specific protease 1-like [Rhodnius prolixus]|uniref:sentrin-specific protease 1-like n=1 Tax=Rhodnius prolixus TaxID=13249 RepID=UPI003D187FAA
MLEIANFFYNILVNLWSSITWPLKKLQYSQKWQENRHGGIARRIKRTKSKKKHVRCVNQNRPARKRKAVSEINLPKNMKVRKTRSAPELRSIDDDQPSSQSLTELAGEIIINLYGFNIRQFDLDTLQGHNLLNDEIIDFYLKMISERSKTEDHLPKVFSFSCFFYQILIRYGYEAVKSWTEYTNIFLFDMLMIPIHMPNHWCLVIVDFKKKLISYYDSLGGTNFFCLHRIQQYLVEEYNTKHKLEMSMEGWIKCSVKDIPKQYNRVDCGVFCCTYADYLARNAAFTFSQKDIPEIRQRMIREITMGKLLN